MWCEKAIREDGRDGEISAINRDGEEIAEETIRPSPCADATISATTYCFSFAKTSHIYPTPRILESLCSSVGVPPFLNPYNAESDTEDTHLICSIYRVCLSDGWGAWVTPTECRRQEGRSQGPHRLLSPMIEPQQIVDKKN